MTLLRWDAHCAGPMATCWEHTRFRIPTVHALQKVLVSKNQCRRSGWPFVPGRQLLSWANGHLPATPMEVRM